MQAYGLLQKQGCPTPQCKYLMARCCMDIGKLSEAEEVLTGNIFSKAKSVDEIETEFGSMSCHALSILGAIFSKTERISKAAECYKKSLKLNPLLWSAFERLCSLGDKSDPVQVFQAPTQSQSTPVMQLTEVPSTVTTSTTVKAPIPILKVTDVLTPVLDGPQACTEVDTNVLETPQPLPPSVSQISVTPENFLEEAPANIFGCPRTKKKVKPRTENVMMSDQSVQKTLFHSPLTPSFGLLPITPSADQPRVGLPFFTPSPPVNCQADLQAPKKPVTRRNQNALPIKPPVFNVNNGTNNTREPTSASNNASREPAVGIQNNPPPVRRSSRLFGSNNSSSVKENNKSQGNKSRFQSTRTLGRKSKTKNTKSQELSIERKPELDIKPVINPEVPTQTEIFQMQQQSLTGILNLLQCIGRAIQALSQFECKKAIETFQELPLHQYNTGFVRSKIGRAYFELADYSQAEKYFSDMRLQEAYYFEGMEIYSTALWHLQKEVELSALAQELSDLDKNSPQAWCVTGNCFSLQKEHDTAIKFFQRAIQIDSGFAYAYTLLGHEYVFTEELDKAMSCFRNAIRVDSRHYNAWYGVGMIYQKQEKFSLAEVHFRKALSINPKSPVLLCHIGVVQHAQQKSEKALITLNNAISIEPKNPLCRFHRASILFSSDKHKEALTELEQLKQIVPKESLVYFLIGKVHKKLGNTHLALMNFSWAMELDPKGINNQIKEAIDKRYATDEDESQIDDSVLLRMEEHVDEASGEFQLHATESDESL